MPSGMPLGTRMCYYPCWMYFDVFLVEFSWCWNWMTWLGMNSLCHFLIAFSFESQEPRSRSDDYPLQRKYAAFIFMAQGYLTNNDRFESSSLLLNIVHMQPGKEKGNCWLMKCESMDCCHPCSCSAIFLAGGRFGFPNTILFTDESTKEISEILPAALCYWNIHGFQNNCEEKKGMYRGFAISVTQGNQYTI